MADTETREWDEGIAHEVNFRRYAWASGQVVCEGDVPHEELDLCAPEQGCLLCTTGDGPRCPYCGAAV